MLEEEELDSFLCPLTLSTFEEPVICIRSGRTYENSALRTYIDNCHAQKKAITDPLTREVFDPTNDVVPNRTLKDAVEEWKEKKGLRQFSTRLDPLLLSTCTVSPRAERVPVYITDLLTLRVEPLLLEN